MHILITGATGFIGTNLSLALAKQNHKLSLLDNLSTSFKPNLSLLQKLPHTSFIKHDVTRPFLLQSHQLYHLACPASPPHYQKNPFKTLETAFLGTRNAIKSALNSNSPLLIASTSEVYGNPSIHPQPESYWGNVNPIGPRSCYDEGKRAAESLAFNAYHQFNLNLRLVRIFNTYGPHMHPKDGRVVSNFILQALQNKPISIYGSGLQTRSFCFVSDLVHALITYMNLPSPTPGPINLGNPQEFTILQLAESIIKLTKSSSSISFLPLPTDDPERRRPDISLAHSTLNWSPSTPLEEGLSQTIHYFKNIL